MSYALRVLAERAVIKIIFLGLMIHWSAGIVSCFRVGNLDSGEGSPQASQGMATNQPPLMLDQIRELIPLLPDLALMGEIKSRGINFKMSRAILESLEALKAEPETIRALTAFISNRPPTVVFHVSQTDTKSGQQVSIESDGKDPDGDHVQYYWATTGGRIYGDGPAVRLDTSGIPADSNEASVTVNVTVIDRKGGSDSHSKTITVRRPQHDFKPYDSKAGQPITEPVRAPVEKVWLEDNLVLVEIDRDAGKSPASWGFIEVSLSATRAAALLHAVTGSLPGVACRVEFVSRENISEYSFKEPPGIFNEWRKVVVRLRPKVAGRPMRFAISWQVIQPR